MSDNIFRLSDEETAAEIARIAARQAEAAAADRTRPILISPEDKRAGRAQGLADQARREGRPLQVERPETVVEAAVRKAQESGVPTVTRAQLDANPGAYRERIMRGELKVAG
jgi:hypothetical protein